MVVARQICKDVEEKLQDLSRFDARPERQMMAPLPAERVNPSPLFTVTGIDHAGPLYFAGRKVYISLFICAVVSAVHL